MPWSASFNFERRNTVLAPQVWTPARRFLRTRTVVRAEVPPAPVFTPIAKAARRVQCWNVAGPETY